MTVIDVNGRVWRRKLPRVRLAPGKCLPCIQSDWRPSQPLERTREQHRAPAELPRDSGPDCEPFPTPGSCCFLNLLVLEGA